MFQCSSAPAIRVFFFFFPSFQPKPHQHLETKILVIEAVLYCTLMRNQYIGQFKFTEEWLCFSLFHWEWWRQSRENTAVEFSARIRSYTGRSGQDRTNQDPNKCSITVDMWTLINETAVLCITCSVFCVHLDSIVHVWGQFSSHHIYAKKLQLEHFKFLLLMHIPHRPNLWFLLSPVCVFQVFMSRHFLYNCSQPILDVKIAFCQVCVPYR